MQTPRRVHDYVVCLTGRSGLQRIEQDGGGISPCFSADHFRSGAFSPDFKLFDCSRAKCVRGAEQDSFALGPEDLSQLTDGRRLAGSVYTDKQNYLWSSVHFLHRLAVRCSQNCQQFFFQEPLKFIDILDLLSICLLPQLAEHLVSCTRAEVGADEGGFQIIKRGAINFLAERDHFLDAVAQVFAGTSNRFLHAIEKARLLLFVQTAKESLNHEN